jgi:hypothetical protein
MSTLKVEALAREFHYNGIRIPDPGPELTVEQVRDLLTPTTRKSPRRPYPAPKRPAQRCATPSPGQSARRAERCMGKR